MRSSRHTPNTEGFETVWQRKPQRQALGAMGCGASVEKGATEKSLSELVPAADEGPDDEVRTRGPMMKGFTLWAPSEVQLVEILDIIPTRRSGSKIFRSTASQPLLPRIWSEAKFMK